MLFRGFKESFSGAVEKISDCRAFSDYVTVPGSLIRSVDNPATLEARGICPLKEQVNFLNRLTVLSNHLIFRWKFCEKF